MARFTIYSPTGTALYTGTPTFTGQYMKPGFLEFREVALALLVELVPGCYVDYTRTGRRYKIYTAPQLKKQARSASYGGAFVYQSVQLYDASKMLEYCPFRDLVTGDNRIHFSTQPSISTFEGCDGLARRFEACLVDQYGAGSWQVRIATAEENPALHDLMLEPRDFTVSGVNILECLDKIYEVWPEVGWVYKVEEVDGVMTDTIVIGGGGANPNVGTYAYGKGNGLTSLTRTAANAEEIANRIFAYGSSRNMVLPSWYRNQDIKDAESVDIQNLMLPIGPVGTPDTPGYWPGWGETDGERDAAKAFVENAASILKNGLRPSTVYFNGNGEYPEIYPTIRETTIGMVRTAIGDSTAKYYPSTTIYTNPDARIDKLLSVQPSFDSGKQSTDGKSAVASDYSDIAETGSGTIPAYSQENETIFEETMTVAEAGSMVISASANLTGSVTAQVYTVILTVIISVNGEMIDGRSEELVNNNGQWALHAVSVGSQKIDLAVGDEVTCLAYIQVVNFGSATPASYSYTANGGYSMKVSLYRSKTFNIALRQVGFDIGAQADLADGKTIAMRTGDCAGRSFSIKSVQYDSANDCWALECWRTEDESLSQWFPNSQFGVAAGDEFVLLDIAMPDIYIAMASQKLLIAARELLADSAVERWQYNPEIDAKFMVENSRTINAGEAMTISDPDIIGENPESVIVDTITISEGESPIPTYKVTLRDRKKKTWTESAMPETSSSKSVGNSSTTVQPTSTGGGDSFFQLDESGNVTLKSQYQNLWVPGWLAAGGVGNGGGGGGVSYLRQLEDVYHDNNGVLRANGGSVQSGDTIVYNDQLGWVAAPITVSGVVKKIACGSYNNLTPDANGLVSITTAVTAQVRWYVNENIIITRHLTTGTLIASIQLGGYNSPAVQIYAPSGGGGSGSTVTVTPLLYYGTPIAEIDVDGSTTTLYAPSGGGGASVLDDLDDVSITGVANGQILVYRDGVWVNENNQGGGGGGGSYSGGTGISINANNVISISTAYQQNIAKGVDAYNSITALANRIAAIEGWFEIVTVNNEQALHAKSGMAIYSDSWIAAGGVGSGGGGGGGSTVAWGQVGEDFVYLSVDSVSRKLLTAHQSLDGYVSKQSLSGLISLASGTNNGTLKLTVNGTVTDNIAVKGLGSLAYKSSLLATDIPDLSGKYVTLDTAQNNISGKKTFTGGLAVDGGSYLDIGDARLVWDATNHALHITKRPGSSYTGDIGVYAEGFVASGATGQSS